jgi:omega-6 fatty acid desaturase (delta-12 desaturase)
MNPSTSRSARERHRAEVAAWKRIVAPFEKPCARKGSWQALSTIGAYAAAWAAMLILQPVSWWLVAPLVLLAGGLLARIFVIFHDCCHGSLLPSPRANHLLGFFTGVLVFTSFRHWRWEHSVHHATAGDLDRRGVGDVWTMTVEEFNASSWWRRLLYRLVRNPFILLVACPLLLFVVRERFSTRGASAPAKRAVMLTNLALAAMLAGGCLLFGWLPFLVIQFSVLAVTATAAVWMFYVQHQFEGVYWERHHHWEYTSAALLGSSFYKLPRILQWFTGNIGYHHVHHLSSKIPNYHLERCHHAHDLFGRSKVLTMKSSLGCLRFRLWDESTKRLVGYHRARELAASVSPAGA